MGWFGWNGGASRPEAARVRADGEGRRTETVEARVVDRPGPRSRLPEDRPRRREVEARGGRR